MASLVVMGVAGCGKSHVGARVAARLGVPLIEGDEFHSAASRERMREGVPLSDADRAGWLDRLGAELARHAAGGAVLTCSALKAAYRERLRAAAPGLRFAWLELDPAAARERVAGRGGGHFFPPQLVQTQFDALEPPLAEPGVLRLDATRPADALAADIAAWLAAADAGR